MGSEWVETTLGNVVSHGGGLIQTGPFGSQLHASDYVNEGVPVVMPVNLAGNRIDLTDIARIRQVDAERLSKHAVRAGDIIYSRRGDVTRKALVGESEAGMLCGTGCLLVRPGRNIHPRFLAYHLSSPVNQEWIIRHAVGATMPNLNTGILAEIPLRVPSWSLQEKIAEILGSVDDKITLNRQINTTLESMAQVLFKSWFVDFDPVIDNALAAGNPIPEPLQARAQARAALGDQRQPLPESIRNQFPDRFVFTEALGWVPEGWGVKLFGDIAEHVRDNAKAEEIEADELYVGLEHIGRKQFFLSDNGYGASVESNKSRFQQGDLLFGKLRPYFHKVCRAPFGGICSTDILVFRAKQAFQASFMYMTAYREAFVEFANSFSTGTRMPRANAKDLLAFQIAIPPDELMSQFDGLAVAMWEKGAKNNQESKSLANLRDTLLPKLLSGELRVPEAELQMAEVL